MDYNFQLQLSFEQLLTLITQLPQIEKNRLLVAMTQNQNNKTSIKTKTVQEILAEDYKYPSKNPQLLTGSWDTNETIETLLNLKTK